MATIFDNFMNAIERLERIIDKETALLMKHQPISFDDFNHNKRHSLLELSCELDAIRALGHRLDLAPNASLKRLRIKLQINLSILQTHLNAAGAVATIIARTIHEHESDGTYTPVIGENCNFR